MQNLLYTDGFICTYRLLKDWHLWEIPEIFQLVDGILCTVEIKVNLQYDFKVFENH